MGIMSNGQVTDVNAQKVVGSDNNIEERIGKRIGNLLKKAGLNLEEGQTVELSLGADGEIGMSNEVAGKDKIVAALKDDNILKNLLTRQQKNQVNSADVTEETAVATVETEAVAQGGVEAQVVEAVQTTSEVTYAFTQSSSSSLEYHTLMKPGVSTEGLEVYEGGFDDLMEEYLSYNESVQSFEDTVQGLIEKGDIKAITNFITDFTEKNVASNLKIEMKYRSGDYAITNTERYTHKDGATSGDGLLSNYEGHEELGLVHMDQVTAQTSKYGSISFEFSKEMKGLLSEGGYFETQYKLGSKFEFSGLDSSVFARMSHQDVVDFAESGDGIEDIENYAVDKDILDNYLGQDGSEDAEYLDNFGNSLSTFFGSDATSERIFDFAKEMYPASEKYKEEGDTQAARQDYMDGAAPAVQQGFSNILSNFTDRADEFADRLMNLHNAVFDKMDEFVGGGILPEESGFEGGHEFAKGSGHKSYSEHYGSMMREELTAVSKPRSTMMTFGVGDKIIAAAGMYSSVNKITYSKMLVDSLVTKHDEVEHRYGQQQEDDNNKFDWITK